MSPMPRPMTTLSRASAIFSSLLLSGLAILTFTDQWWPWIMLVIGIPLSIRQYLLGRYHDTIVSIAVFGGVFVTAEYDVAWNVILPVVFITSAIYVLFREFAIRKPTYEDEEESHNIELEVESQEHPKKDQK